MEPGAVAAALSVTAVDRNRFEVALADLVAMTAPLIALNDGNAIPSVGLGVLQTPPKATEQAVSAALEAGYRHIDTAAAYNNEREVGRAVKKSGIPREEVFVVTKLWNADQGYDSTMKAFEKSAKRLGLGEDGSTCT